MTPLTLIFRAVKLRSKNDHVVPGVFMPRTSPYNIRLTPTELEELLDRAGKYTAPYFQVQRAKMILLASEGLTNDQIAARLDTRREVVSFWRKRFFTERLAGLEERSRPGRPPNVARSQTQ